MIQKLFVNFMCVVICVCVQANRAVAQLESEMSKLQQTASLFEVSFPEYKQLGQCRSDLILVKAVWDMVMFVKVIQTPAQIQNICHVVEMPFYLFKICFLTKFCLESCALIGWRWE